jgi:hypothetical protein
MCNDCKLYASSQRKFLRVAHSVSSLKIVSYRFAARSGCMYFFKSMIHDGSQVSFGYFGEDLAYSPANMLFMLGIGDRSTA